MKWKEYIVLPFMFAIGLILLPVLIAANWVINLGKKGKKEIERL